MPTENTFDRATQVVRLTPAEAAKYARRASITIYRALEAGKLHGSQAKAGGRWNIRPECLEAWLDNEPCIHKRKAPRSTALRLA